MKKFIAIFLSIALILSCAVTTVIAETPTDATGTTFTATDVYNLIQHIKATVKEQFQVELEPEVRFLGEF